MFLSVVVPCYKCESSINPLTNRLIVVLEAISDTFEIIYVNDASPENDWAVIKEVAQKDKRIKGINMSRNFGQHYAITAGLKYAGGEWVVVMDGDLQDVPEEIPKLYEKTKEGFLVVKASRVARKDTFFKRYASQIFSKLFFLLTEAPQDHQVSNFGIYSKVVVEEFLKLRDASRSFLYLVNWLGFPKAVVPVRHSEREHGESSYSLKKSIDLALDIILSLSDKPLKLIVKFGFILSVISMGFAFFFCVQFFLGKITVLGWPSLIISLWFLSGVIIFVLGLVGLYVGKIFKQVQQRPLFIVQETINANKLNH